MTWREQFTWALFCMSMVTYAKIPELNVIHPAKTFALARTFISPGDLVFDVGAHAGTKTSFYIACGARVVCIEPQKPFIAYLHDLFAACPQVIAIEGCGLAAQPGIMKLYHCSNASMITSFSKQWQEKSRFAQKGFVWDVEYDVPMRTLDELIAQYGLPQFCKIDVEGFEYEVLAGLNHKIPTLSFECNSEYMEATQLCLERLVALGYTKFNFTVAEQADLIFENWLPADLFLAQLRRLASEYDWQAIWGLWGDVYAQ